MPDGGLIGGATEAARGPDPFAGDEDFVNPPDPFKMDDDFVDPRPKKVKAQDDRLSQARQWAQQRGASEGEAFQNTLGGIGVSTRDIQQMIPFGSSMFGAVKEEQYRAAQQAYEAGEATDKQLGQKAFYELLEQRRAAMGPGRAALQTAIGLPAVAGEALAAGGAARAAGGALGLGAAGTVAGRVAQRVGTQLATTPLMPSLYVQDAERRATEGGGEWYDSRNILPALGVAGIKNVILGTVGGQVGGINARLAARIPAAAAVGTFENQVADAALQGLDDLGISDSIKFKTNYGVIGDLIDGRRGDVWKHLASDAVAFGAFGAAHGRDAKPVEKFKDVVDSLQEAGLKPEEAARQIAQEAAPVMEAARQGDPTAAQMADQLPDGPMKEYLKSLVDAGRPTEATPANDTPKGRLDALTQQRDKLDIAVSEAQKGLSAAAGDPDAMRAAQQALKDAKKARKAIQGPLDAARDAINRVPTAPGTKPAETTAEGEIAPPAAGMVRFYHGGEPPGPGDARWVSSDRAYAEGYARKSGAGVHAVDVPIDHPALQDDIQAFEHSTGLKGTPENIARSGMRLQLPPEFGSKFRPFPAGEGEIAPPEPEESGPKDLLGIPISKELHELHRSPVRDRGLETSPHAAGEAYLSRVLDLTKSRAPERTATAEEAISDFHRGDFRSATFKSEQAIGWIHGKERDAYVASKFPEATERRQTEGEAPGGVERRQPEGWYRVPDYKGQGTNLDALRKELFGGTFPKLWFSKGRLAAGPYHGEGRFQLDFDPGKVGGEGDVVEHRGRNEVGVGGNAPMAMHPALRAIRFKGAETNPDFADLKATIDSINPERVKAGLDPIRLEATRKPTPEEVQGARAHADLDLEANAIRGELVRRGINPEFVDKVRAGHESAAQAEDQARGGAETARSPEAEGGRVPVQEGPEAGGAEGGAAAPAGPAGGEATSAGGGVPAGPAQGPVSSPAEQAAEQLLAAKLASVDRPLGTAAPANFAEAQKQAKEGARTFVQRVVDGFRELGGAIAPRTSRLSEEAGNKIARLISARAAAGEQAPVLIDKVLPEPIKNGKDLDLLAGAVLVETRLRKIRQAHLGAGNEDVAKDVETIIGKPLEKDGDPYKNPLLTEHDYQSALRDPDVLATLNRYGEDVGPVLDRNYRISEGIDEHEDIPNFTQIPGMPVNLKAWSKSEGGVGVNLAGNLSNVRARRSLFARLAKGNAEGYDLSLSAMIGHSLKANAEAAAKVELYRQLVKDGLAKFGKYKQRPPGFDHEVPNAVPARGLRTLANAGETSLFLRDAAVWGEVRKAIQVDQPWRQIPGAGIFNTAMLTSLGEVTAHTKNLLTMAMKPSMRPVRDFLPNVLRVIRKDPQIRDRLVELAQIGAMKPKGLETNDFAQSKFALTKYTGKLLDVVDRAMRLSADSAWGRLARRPGVTATEGARRDFINQLGQYNKRAQNSLIRAARDTGIGPFATAGSNFYVNSLRNLFLGHGVKTETIRADLALRGEMLVRFAAVASIVPIWNYAATGSVFGDEKTPIGAIHLGKDSKGNTQFFDLLGLTGITRGLRQTGLLALGEGQRPGAKAMGAQTGETLDKSFGDIGRGIAHPFEGPIFQFAHTLFTGQDTLGREEAKHATGGESQAKYNAIAALIHMNPIVSAALQLLHVDPKVQKTDTAREIMKQLGPYGIKTGTMPPGAPHRTMTVPDRR